jgi:hypothetical protein
MEYALGSKALQLSTMKMYEYFRTHIVCLNGQIFLPYIFHVMPSSVKGLGFV